MGDIGPVRARYEVLPEPVEYVPDREVEPSRPRKARARVRRPDDVRRDAAR